jgi:hypothetical protein
MEEGWYNKNRKYKHLEGKIKLGQNSGNGLFQSFRR